MRLGSRKSLVRMGENYLQRSKSQDLQRMTSSLLRMKGKIGVDGENSKESDKRMGRQREVMKDVICHAKEFGFYPEWSVETWMGSKSVADIIR